MRRLGRFEWRWVARGVSHTFSIGEMRGEEVLGMSLASEKTLSAQPGA